MADDWNEQIIAEFRSNGGKVGGPFENMTLSRSAPTPTTW